MAVDSIQISPNIWMLYDNNMKLIPEGSGAKRVTDPNQLGTLIEQDIPALTDGYLHCDACPARSRRVSNTGLEPISYDNFMVTYLRGKTRQINHYYPYGLSISSLSYSDEYLNKYTSKELQTGEFGSLALSSGLEMFDFGSRFYDPALGRWFTPDPAEQFANPYLAMGCNPVMYVDPDGEFIMFAIAMGAITNMIVQGLTGNVNSIGDAGLALGIGGLTGAASFGAGAGVQAGLGFIGGAIKGGAAGFAGGFVGGSGNAWAGGADFIDGITAGVKGGMAGAGVGAAIGGISGGVKAVRHNGDFWTGEGSTFEFSSTYQVDGNSPPVEYSTESANEFSDTYLTRPKELNALYANQTSIPDGYTLSDNGMNVLNVRTGKPAQGVTVSLSHGKSNVYLYPQAFSSHEQLYLVMNHEYLHVRYFGQGLYNEYKQEAWARKWMYDQGNAWNFKAESLLKLHQNFPIPIFSGRYNYSKFGYGILPQTPW